MTILQSELILAYYLRKEIVIHRRESLLLKITHAGDCKFKQTAKSQSIN